MAALGKDLIAEREHARRNRNHRAQRRQPDDRLASVRASRSAGGTTGSGAPDCSSGPGLGTPTTSLQIGQFSRDRSGMFAENGVGGRRMSTMKVVRSN
jgi:hypothetical protein